MKRCDKCGILLDNGDWWNLHGGAIACDDCYRNALDEEREFIERQKDQCACSWCSVNKAVYFDIPDKFGRPEQLCSACYAVRMAELPQPESVIL